MWWKKKHKHTFFFQKICNTVVFVAAVSIQEQHNQLFFAEALRSEFWDEVVTQVLQDHSKIDVPFSGRRKHWFKIGVGFLTFWVLLLEFLYGQ
jgi:hypothetical protein